MNRLVSRVYKAAQRIFSSSAGINFHIQSAYSFIEVDTSTLFAFLEKVKVESRYAFQARDV